VIFKHIARLINHSSISSLPVEGIDPTDNAVDREITPLPRPEEQLEVRAQSEVQLQEIPLLADDEAAAIRLLQERGIISPEYDPTVHSLRPVPTTRVAERQAMRNSLDTRVRTEAARILNERNISPGGRNLDRQRLGRDNLIVVKTAIDRQIQALTGRERGQRHEYTRAELELIDVQFQRLVSDAIAEVFNGD
jgi:hypothetical protein